MSTGFLSDDPRDGSTAKPDDLGRAAFVDHVAALLSSVRDQSPSSVIGLTGDWGSGKSTVLQMVLRRLKAGDGAQRWLVAEFNPWTYPDTEAMQRGFFAELKSVLPEELQGGSAREAIGAFAKTISPLGSLAALAGLNAQPLVKFAGNLIAGDMSVTAKQREAAQALEQLRVPVLMVIDDLDRLTPDELLDVLKFVRLVGRLPNIYYLLCYDEHTLLDVLASTPLVGRETDRAKAYLEKIVQVRVDMPALRPTQRLTMLDTGLDKILAANTIHLGPDDTARLSGIYDRAFERRLATPRAINHYLGQVQAFFPTLRGEADFVDFLLVTWLRIHEPGVYRLLHEHRAALLGRSLEELAERRNEGAAPRQERWRRMLRKAQVSDENLDGVVAVLSALFPHVHSVFESDRYIASAQNAQHRRAISDETYYDRYLNFGVPDDDIRDTLVAAALHALYVGEETPELVRVATELRQDTRRIVTKIDALEAEGTQLPHTALFNLVVSIVDEVNQNQGFLTNPNRLLAGIAANALAALPADERRALVRSTGQSDTAKRLAVDAVRLLDQRTRHPEYGQRTLPADDLTAVRTELADVLRKRFEAQPTATPATFTELSELLFRAWLRYDHERASDWLRAGVDDHKWTLRDVLPHFVSRAWVSGGGDAHAAIGEFDVEALEAVFGQQCILDELTEDLDNAPANVDSWTTEPTLENCQLYALSILRHRRDNPDPAAPAE